MRPASDAPSIEQLAGGGYVATGELTHASLASFVIEYFFRRGSWLTVAHHAMSLATLGAAVTVGLLQEKTFLAGVAAFVLAIPAVIVVVLPLHELLHAVAYWLVGARDIRWGYSVSMAAVWVIAHRYVAAAGPFIFVALVPFVVINAALIATAILVPQLALFFLFVLLWHLHGCAGDWSLLNFIWLHRERGFWTYDDAVEGKSYFFGHSL